jgi:hypothetical protein
MNKLTALLVKLIKDDIKKKGLVDTGKMLSSVEVKLSNLSGSIVLDVLIEDYFKYLDSRYNILDDVTSTREWNEALEDEVANLIEKTLG